ncbi:hypothetical protein GY21_20195 [Cryobacterium roopkundense]|uniref:Uncharacterized protein n=1 Tax=Cryobacterium roopkundense TaxID=1001240 RepID=A0A099IZZ1_9MICO|nr:hypothetical protein [Cryobacterium roopkundense]KGJ71729.1 hypothetical protein GY21_20195 [Cryobacterium roopkundense]MBB5642542.1 hypothetical protein [Cryobacterium roopkundense]
MNGDEFLALVRDFFGAKATQVTVDPSGSVATCVLYDSFVFTCGLNGEHGTFTGGIEYDTGKYLTVFLNERLSFNTDRESILRNLQIVDRYCRLRLPDKFLASSGA